MPTSWASAFADILFGPVILWTIRARNPSLYSVISLACAPPRSRLAEAASILTQGVLLDLFSRSVVGWATSAINVFERSRGRS